MPKPNESFAKYMKEHQISWAHQNGLSELLEQRKDNIPSWVLKEGYESRNLRDPSWWQYIKGREHKWARSLLSSQCFAVNVFGPLVATPILAKQLLAELLPHRILEKGDEVTAGQPLMVIEAMKMENELRASAAGTVKSVEVSPGTAVEKGFLLVALE